MAGLETEAQAVIPTHLLVKNKSGSVNWEGNKFDVCVYKSDSLLAMAKEVGAGCQVNFEVLPQLYFAVVSPSFQHGEFKVQDLISTEPKLVDLSKYPDGVTVTLTRHAESGSYTFAMTEMYNELR